MTWVKVIGVIWIILLLLKIICKDEEWGYFIMITTFLLLFLLSYFCLPLSLSYFSARNVDTADEIIKVEEVAITKVNSSVEASSSSSEDSGKKQIKKRSPKPRKVKQAAQKPVTRTRSTKPRNETKEKKQEKVEIKPDPEDMERTAKVRLEITELPPEKAGEDPKQDVKIGIVVDPDKENPMYVAVQAKVSDNEMDVEAKAATEGEGKAEVSAEIQKGTANNKDK